MATTAISMQILSWILAGTTILVMWLMGNKTKWGPALGLVNVVLWTVYNLLTKQYAFIILQVLYMVTHTRNLIKWWREDAAYTHRA